MYLLWTHILNGPLFPVKSEIIYHSIKKKTTYKLSMNQTTDFEGRLVNNIQRVREQWICY